MIRLTRGLFITFLLCWSTLVFGISKTDSLKQQLAVYSSEKNDSMYHETIIELVEIHRNFDVAKAIQFANNGLELANKTKNDSRKGYWYGIIGDLYVLHDEQLLALESFHKGLDLARQRGEYTGWWHISIGNVYFSDHLNLMKAERSYEMAIREFRKMGNDPNGWRGIAVAFNNIGLVYESKEDYLTSVEYYNKGLNIRRLLEDKELIGHSYSMLAEAYMHVNHDSSRYYFDQVYEMVKGTKDEFSYYLNVSELYRKTGEYEKARKAIEKAENIAKTSNMLTFLPLVYREYSDICSDDKEYEQAIEYSEKGLKFAENERLINYALPLLEQLIKLYSVKNDYKRAFAYQQEFIELKDSLHEDQVKNAEVNYELEENQKEVNFLKDNLTDIIQLEHQLEDENKRQHDFLLTFEWGFALAIVMGIFLLWSFMKQRKQKVEIRLAHDEVVSSIKYAETIQQAIFPKRDIYDHAFLDHFLIKRAKENLSGDFNFLKITQKNIVFAIGDCTGHGVPGALLSVLGISFLNEVIRREEVNTPAAALEQMKYQINTNFENSKNTDGMDVALCTIGKENGIITFSGAYIPLYVIRSGELITLNATRTSIGLTHNEIPFEDVVFQLEKGDKLYVFTDGFTDQFGTDGGRVRKFSRKRLLELLLTHWDKDMASQKKYITQAFDDWKRNEEQTDDITVLGLQWS